MRATCLPRSTTVVAAGVGVLGLASLGFLAVAGRALGPERFGALAIFWVLLNTLGAGLFLPLEQHVSRELASDIGLVLGAATKRHAQLNLDEHEIFDLRRDGGLEFDVRNDALF